MVSAVVNRKDLVLERAFADFQPGACDRSGINHQIVKPLKGLIYRSPNLQNGVRNAKEDLRFGHVHSKCPLLVSTRSITTSDGGSIGGSIGPPGVLYRKRIKSHVPDDGPREKSYARCVASGREGSRKRRVGLAMEEG